MKKFILLGMILVVSVVVLSAAIGKVRRDVAVYEKDPAVWAQKHQLVEGWRSYTVSSSTETIWGLARLAKKYSVRKVDTRLLVDIIISKNKLKNSLYAGQQVLLPVID